MHDFGNPTDNWKIEKKYSTPEGQWANGNVVAEIIFNKKIDYIEELTESGYINAMCTTDGQTDCWRIEDVVVKIGEEYPVTALLL